MDEALQKMMRKMMSWMSLLVGVALLTTTLPQRGVAQDQDDPPGRVARLGYMWPQTPLPSEHPQQLTPPPAATVACAAAATAHAAQAAGAGREEGREATAATAVAEAAAKT
jgi:hypothetical protein